MGLEPTTLSLDPPVGGLPTELRFIQIFSTKFPALCSLSGKWGSNPRPSAWIRQLADVSDYWRTTNRATFYSNIFN